MKIKMFFDTVDEFAVFILSASSARLKLDFWSTKTNLPLPDFFYSVSEIQINEIDVTYSVTFIKSEFEYLQSNTVDCKIRNYMLNDIQIKCDCIFVETDGIEETIIGSENVRKHLLSLPDSFLLSVGWMTDYSDYVIRKLH